MQGNSLLLTLCAATSISGLQFATRAQLVPTGPVDPHYCEHVRVRPNLMLRQAASVSGSIVDESGAPFKNSRVELRSYISETKQKSLRTTVTNQGGMFRFDDVGPGRYRLLASPSRAFSQPEQLMCSRTACNLPITLQVNPTDLPDSQCPIK